MALVHGEYDLGRHPVGRADERVGGRGERARAEVGELDEALVGEQYVARLDVAVYVALGVYVGERVQGVAHDGGYLGLSQRLLVHLEEIGGRAEAIVHDEPGHLVLEVAAAVGDAVGVRQRLDEAQLLLDLEPLLARLLAAVVHHLDGDHLAAAHVLAEVDGAEVAVADLGQLVEQLGRIVRFDLVLHAIVARFHRLLLLLLLLLLVCAAAVAIDAVE